MAERIERAAAEKDDNPNFKEFTKQVSAEVNAHQNVMSVDSGLAGELNNGRKDLDARSQSAAGTLFDLANVAVKGNAAGVASPADQTVHQVAAAGLAYLQHRKELQQALFGFYLKFPFRAALPARWAGSTSIF